MEPKVRAMQQVLQQQVTVQAGGKVELVCPELKAGEVVDVVVSAAVDPARSSDGQPGNENSRPRRSVLDILNDGPSERLFKTADEVDQYIREERDSWDR